MARINMKKVQKTISNFSSLMMNINALANVAQDEEKAPEEATQDFLHILEIKPELFEGKEENVLATLHDLRSVRRAAKNELEVITLLQDYYNKNAKVINELGVIIGKVRKALERQDRDFYVLRTGEFGLASNPIVRDKVPPQDDSFVADNEMTICCGRKHCDECFFQKYGEVECQRQFMMWLVEKMREERRQDKEWYLGDK